MGQIKVWFEHIAAPIRAFFFGVSRAATAVAVAAAKAPEFLKTAETATVVIEYQYGTQQVYADGIKAGGASGCIIEYRGKKYVATNIHVLFGEATSQVALAWTEGAESLEAPGSRLPETSRLHSSFDEFVFYLSGIRQRPSLRNPPRPIRMPVPMPIVKDPASGAKLKLSQPFLLSAARDLALLPVETSLPALQLSATPPTRNQKIGVVGNPQAAHTIAVLSGEIRAVGPDRIELQGLGLTPGMSGGPIINMSNGGLLGLVTYSITRTGFTGAVGGLYSSSVREFGYRLDNVHDFQPVSWGEFVRQVGIVHAIDERTLNVWRATDLPLQKLSNRGFFPSYEIGPDSDNSVQMACGSMIRDIERASLANDFKHYGKMWSAYQRLLERLLDKDLGKDLSDASAPGRLITLPYLKGLLVSTTAEDRRFVASFLRESAGKIPGRTAANQ
jgi:hypothetical protein